MPGPTLTTVALAHLAGRPLVLRLSPRHGCCGGLALVPVAEVGPPSEPERYLRYDDGPVACFVDEALEDEAARWCVDAAGVGRWRRLVLVGAEGFAPGGAEEHRHA
jgi:hypothetical protein